MMIPQGYQFWDGKQMFEVVSIDFSEQTVKVKCLKSGVEDIRQIKSGVLLLNTGIIDQFGTPLFVGDIIQVTPLLVSNEPSYVAAVEWDKYRFALRVCNWEAHQFRLPPYSNLDPFGKFIKKIGNIFQQPELAA